MKKDYCGFVQGYFITSGKVKDCFITPEAVKGVYEQIRNNEKLRQVHYNHDLSKKPVGEVVNCELKTKDDWAGIRISVGVFDKNAWEEIETDKLRGFSPTLKDVSSDDLKPAVYADILVESGEFDAETKEKLKASLGKNMPTSVNEVRKFNDVPIHIVQVTFDVQNYFFVVDPNLLKTFGELYAIKQFTDNFVTDVYNWLKQNLKELLKSKRPVEAVSFDIIIDGIQVRIYLPIRKSESVEKLLELKKNAEEITKKAISDNTQRNIKQVIIHYDPNIDGWGVRIV